MGHKPKDKHKSYNFISILNILLLLCFLLYRELYNYRNDTKISPTASNSAVTKPPPCSFPVLIWAVLLGQWIVSLKSYWYLKNKRQKRRISSVKSCRRNNSFFHIRIFNSLKVRGIERVASIFHAAVAHCPFFSYKTWSWRRNTFFCCCLDNIQLSKFVFQFSVLPTYYFLFRALRSWSCGK